MSEATLAGIEDFVRARGWSVLTFVGYSGAGYEDPDSVMRQVEAVLAERDPRRTIVNIGATAAGIGAAYEVARREGFPTMGIVSTLARDQQVELSPCVEHVFFVADSTWGGRMAGSGRLSPASAAIVAVSDTVVAIGGGDVARDEWLEARQAGREVIFIAADMNHAAARAKAQQRGDPEPSDFRGAAQRAIGATGATHPDVPR